MISFFQLGFIPNPFGRHPGSDGALGHPFPCPRQYLQCNHHKLTQGRRTQRPSGKMCNRVSLLSINMLNRPKCSALPQRTVELESHLFKNCGSTRNSPNDHTSYQFFSLPFNRMLFEIRYEKPLTMTDLQLLSSLRCLQM